MEETTAIINLWKNQKNNPRLKDASPEYRAGFEDGVASLLKELFDFVEKEEK